MINLSSVDASRKWLIGRKEKWESSQDKYSSTSELLQRLIIKRLNVPLRQAQNFLCFSGFSVLVPPRLIRPLGNLVEDIDDRFRIRCVIDDIP